MSTDVITRKKICVFNKYRDFCIYENILSHLCHNKPSMIVVEAKYIDFVRVFTICIVLLSTF